ncbi:MAG: hypothetical protein KGM98_09445 [Bacteroidota bacterium]|nr:hypothetical protein [Bacteroidota bacterium]
MRKYFTTLCLLSLIGYKGFSQKILPDVSVTRVGTRVLVSWNNPFTSLSDILIQRSTDSLKNFKTIGNVLNVHSRLNGFVDNSELSTPQYYRVFITFEGGSYLFSPSYRPSAPLPQATRGIQETYQEAHLPPNNKIISRPPAMVKNVFVPSRHVFTGKDNNVIILLPDASHRKYSIKFFEGDGTPLFEIKHLPEPRLILDKSNFTHSGLFNFELYEDGNLLEKNKVFIPKDGEPMPALDAQGNELR